jgi:ABC-type dipeptide/oligopeptide/nickel transport system ATPase component
MTSPSIKINVERGPVQSTGGPLLTVEGMNVQFGEGEAAVHAVKNVDLTIDHGECVGIVGESGSGKSTLARSISRLAPAARNGESVRTLRFNDVDIFDLKGENLRRLRRKSGFSMVFQDPVGYLNPTMRIWRQVNEALNDSPAAEPSRARITRLFEEVGLSNARDVANRYPHELSGGMRQRVMIAMALASEPLLLVADEPTSSLDTTVQLQVLDTLRRLHRDRGMAILIITHDFGVIAEMCDRVYVMRNGEVVESGATIPLFENPAHPYTAKLLELSRASHVGLSQAQDQRTGDPSGVNDGHSI